MTIAEFLWTSMEFMILNVFSRNPSRNLDIPWGIARVEEPGTPGRPQNQYACRISEMSWYFMEVQEIYLAT